MTKHEAVQQWLDLKFGLFIHFGLYSLPAGVWNGAPVSRGYSEQILSHGYLPQADYEALIERFSLPAFDPRHIVQVAREAGMRYMVLTAKHHDGFCLFDTRTTDYNSANAPCALDIVGALSQECGRQGMGFGVYFSWIDWHFPEAVAISSHNSDPIPEAHQKLNVAQLGELLSNYGPLRELWMDMGAPTEAQSQEVYDLVRGLQPRCAINGRIWNDRQDFLTMGDNELPSVPLDCPWQTPASIYKETWGYRRWQVRGDKEEKIAELSRAAREVVGAGGNYLLNIGLKGDGAIQSFEEEVLKGIGRELAEGPLRRKEGHLDLAPLSFDNGTLECRNGVKVYRYTGSDYYSYRPIPTSLHWELELTQDTEVSIAWKSAQPLQREQKLCLEVGERMFYSSLQKGRSADSFVTALPLARGRHHLCLHTVGSPLRRPELVDTTIAVVLKRMDKE